MRKLEKKQAKIKVKKTFKQKKKRGLAEVVVEKEIGRKTRRKIKNDQNQKKRMRKNLIIRIKIGKINADQEVINEDRY